MGGSQRFFHLNVNLNIALTSLIFNLTTLYRSICKKELSGEKNQREDTDSR